MIIEIKGVQFVNKGAHLMLVAIQQQLQARFGNEVNIALAPNELSPYFKRAKTGAYQKLNMNIRFIDFTFLSYFLPKFIRKSLKKSFGIVMEPDIDAILDASGFTYGDQWGPRAVLLTANQIKRLHKNQRPFIFMPQAFGPFSRKIDQHLLSKNLKKAALIFPRDKKSLEHIQKFTKGYGNTFLFPDFTNLCLPVQKYPNAELVKDHILLIPNSKMLSEHNKNKLWKQNYKNVLSSFIKVGHQLGHKVILLNHEGDEDQAICHELNQMFPEVEILSPHDPLEVKAIIGAAKLVFSSRFHGCVSSLSQGVPCLGTSWSHKYEALFQDYDALNLLISPEIQEQTLKETVDLALKEETKTNLIAHSDHWKKQSEAMWEKIFEKLNA